MEEKLGKGWRQLARYGVELRGYETAATTWAGGGRRHWTSGCGGGNLAVVAPVKLALGSLCREPACAGDERAAWLDAAVGLSRALHQSNEAVGRTSRGGSAVGTYLALKDILAALDVPADLDKLVVEIEANLAVLETSYQKFRPLLEPGVLTRAAARNWIGVPARVSLVLACTPGGTRAERQQVVDAWRDQVPLVGAAGLSAKLVPVLDEEVERLVGMPDMWLFTNRAQGAYSDAVGEVAMHLWPGQKLDDHLRAHRLPGAVALHCQQDGLSVFTEGDTDEVLEIVAALLRDTPGYGSDDIEDHLATARALAG